jgi:hypothetical protein
MCRLLLDEGISSPHSWHLAIPRDVVKYGKKFDDLIT